MPARPTIPHRHLPSWLWLLPALWLLTSPQIAQGASTEASEQVDEIMEGERFQRELEVELPDGWGKQPPIVRQRPPEPKKPDADWSPRASGDFELGGALLWLLIGVAVVLVVVGLANRFSNYTPDVKASQKAGADEPQVGARALREGPAAEAEALASMGRYTEAIHALLLRTLEALSKTRALRPAMTSREIVAHIKLNDDARAALNHLVDAVEISFFGGREPGQEAWGSCRESFERFLQVYEKGAS